MKNKFNDPAYKRILLEGILKVYIYLLISLFYIILLLDRIRIKLVHLFCCLLKNLELNLENQRKFIEGPFLPRGAPWPRQRFE